MFRQKDIKDIFSFLDRKTHKEHVLLFKTERHKEHILFFLDRKDIKNIILKSEQQRNKFLKTEGLIRSA